MQNLKVESLDDLFEDENNAPQPEKKNEELKPQNLDLNSFEDEAPVLPQESEDDDTYDLQKELEAKLMNYLDQLKMMTNKIYVSA